MPTVGSFHAKFWSARANPLPEPTTTLTHQYPRVQSVILVASFFGALQPAWDQCVWYWRLAKRLWHWQAPQNQDRLEQWIARLEELDPEQHAVLERVVAALQSPVWHEAQDAVRAVATSPKFHQPEQWVEYGRTLKANIGQAQNVFRHLKAVSALRELRDTPVARMSNPDAHLLIELAYQGMAATARPDRRVIAHPVLHRKEGGVVFPLSQT